MSERQTVHQGEGMLTGRLRAARRSPPQVSIHPIYPSILYPSISSRYHGGGQREIIDCLHVPAAAEGRLHKITTERDGGRQGEILGRRRNLIRGCRRKKEGSGEKKKKRMTLARLIIRTFLTGASTSDRTPRLSSLPPSVPPFYCCRSFWID